MANFTARIRVGGTVGDGETPTVGFRLDFIDDAMSKSVEKSFNQTAALWLDDDATFELTLAHAIVWAIVVDAKTDFMSSSMTVQIGVHEKTA